MTVRLSDGAIILEGACLLDDATILLDLMLAHPAATIDLDKCTRLHMAVAQVLLAAQRPVLRPPDDAFLRERLAVLLPTVAN